MLTLLHGLALAAPFQTGAMEPVPAEPSDIGILQGKLLLLTPTTLFRRSEGGWEDTGQPGGRALWVEGDSYTICGPTGVVRYGLDEEVLSTRPCTGLATVDEALWMLGPDGVTRVDGTAITVTGTPTLLGGTSDAATLEGTQLTLAGKNHLVFPGTSDLARTAAGWLLVHPERKLLGTLGANGLESAWPLPFAANAITVGDLDSDGSDEVVVAGPEGWTTVRFGPPPVAVVAPSPRPVATVLPPRKRWEPPPSTTMFGIRFPHFAGLEPDADYDTIFIGGPGLVSGSSLGSSQSAIGFSPSAAGGLEAGKGRLRSFAGIDSAPLFIWSGPTGGIHLAMLSAGFTVGSDRLRFGPFATAGLLAAGAGLRAVFTPFESRLGKLTGLEARVTWFAPTTAHASLYYVSAVPLGRRARDDAPKRAERTSGCKRFGISLGAAGGLSSTASAWQFVGRDAPYQFSASPALAMSCEGSGWVLGVESAPFFFYRVPVLDGGSDVRLYHRGSITMGLQAGGKRFRFGPVATAGVWTAGAGLRMVITPFQTKQNAWHGLEIRALALFPSAPAVEGMLFWHVWFDPKHKKSS